MRRSVTGSGGRLTEEALDDNDTEAEDGGVGNAEAEDHEHHDLPPVVVQRVNAEKNKD